MELTTDDSKRMHTTFLMVAIQQKWPALICKQAMHLFIATDSLSYFKRYKVSYMHISFYSDLLCIKACPESPF